MKLGKFSDDEDDVPSAPPIAGSGQEIKDAAERKDQSACTPVSEVKPDHDIENENSGQNVRLETKFMLKFLFTVDSYSSTS